MRKLFISSINVFHYGIYLFLLISSFSLNAQCPDNVLTGNAFNDANYNGTFDPGESGIGNVMASAFGIDGLLAGQAITNSTGLYSIAGLDAGESYRVEFVFPSDLLISNIGADNGSDVQFAQSGNCNVSIGLNNSNVDCGTNPDIYLTCFVRGDATENTAEATIISTEFGFNGASTVNVNATKANTGSIWGLAYRSASKDLYSASFVKQYAGLTAFGHDAIFVTNTQNNQTNLFTKLSTLGANVGALTYSNAQDCNYGSQVGKIGLGGLEISEDQNYLFAANMFDNTIVKFPTTNPTAANSEVIQVPDPACSNGDYNVFAVKAYNGKLYVGVTCTEFTSQVGANSSANVYEMDLSTNSFDLVFSTNFITGYWFDTPTDQYRTQQWLTDIDFTKDGHMVLGISDRLGHRFCNNTDGRVDNQLGDILMVFNDNGVFKLEDNAGLNGVTLGSGPNSIDGQGPGGGEFFGEDFFPGNKALHPEVALGSIYINPNGDEVISAVYDPLFTTYSGGLHRYSTTNGTRTSSIELYNNNIEEYFGKATGFGDIVGACGIVPFTVGNYVWCDDNKNGIQDVGELPITDVKLNIYDDNCNQVGTTTTSANGYYSFNTSNVDIDQNGTFDGLVTGKTYYVAIDDMHYDAEHYNYELMGTNLILTSVENSKIGSKIGKHPEICPDIVRMGLLVIENLGANSNDFDLGLAKAKDFDLAIDLELTTPPPYRIGNDVTFDLCVTNEGCMIAKDYTVVNYTGPNYKFNAADNPNWRDGVYPKRKIEEILCPGETECVEIILELIGNDIDGYINSGEISGATDQFCEPAKDIDSTPDDDPENDDLDPTTSAPGDAPGDNTEDDFDSDEFRVVDLALKKTLSVQKAYSKGEDVCFDIMVCNQGSEDIMSFDIHEIYTDDLKFDEDENEGWDISGTNTLKFSCNDRLSRGACKTLKVCYEIAADANDYFVSYSEISGFVAENPEMTTDVDSTPDTNNTNDNGGVPESATDNETEDNGTIDEDDHDPVVVRVNYFDLALTKVTKTSVVKAGDIVNFDITIYNQGQLTANQVEIVDYLPPNTTLMDGSWSVDSSDPSGRTVSQIFNIPGGLGANGTFVATIAIRIDAIYDYKDLVNYAEIACAKDLDGNKLSDFDIDSEADKSRFNDAGGVDAEDDELLGDGTIDEDDHDSARLGITAFDPCECLDNATTTSLGQFSDVITVIAPSGQTWSLDFVNDLYDPLVLPIVDGTIYALTPFVTGTGAGATTFVEDLGDPADGFSTYTLTGIFVEGTCWEVRITNGFDYVQLEGDCDCEYDNSISQINGPNAVCDPAMATYTVDALPGDCIYDWTIIGGIPAAGTGTSIDVTWDPGAAVHQVQLDYNCIGLECAPPVILDVALGTTPGVMACVHELNISLDDDCAVTITPQMLMTEDLAPGMTYAVMLMDPHGDLIPGNIVTDAHKDMAITAKLIDACSGNTCWATLTIEDKTPPQLQCGNFEMYCHQMETYEPIAYDNCSEIVSIRLLDEQVNLLNCHPKYIKEVTRVYEAEDACGNISDPCTYVFSLLRLDFDEIVAPLNYEIPTTAFTCEEMEGHYLENGFPDPAFTGVPVLNGLPLYPNFNFYCNVATDYTDIELSNSDCVKKFMRTWLVYEAWCSVGQLDTIVQIIQVQDTENPIVSCNESLFLSTSEPGCTHTVFIEAPEVSDDCTTVPRIDVAYPGDFKENIGAGVNLTLETGQSTLTFTVYDACGNSAMCTQEVFISDNNPPVTICDEYTVVSLRSDGSAEAFANTFDDGSYDDCSLRKFLVRRMGDSPCDCERPHFHDHDYLGEYNGHFYYLSNEAVPGQKAIDLAEAHGGYLAILNDLAENSFLATAVSNILTDGEYYIGLNETLNETSFQWVDGSYPNYTLPWAMGQPNSELGDFVFSHLNGTWEVGDGARTERYVIEVSDPCGFSDYVDFCCTDVKAEGEELPMVIMRAVDYFGNYNQCMVSVEVQDKTPPVLTCPADMEVVCTTVYDLDNLSATFGKATATDACAVEIDSSYVEKFGTCGIETLTRTFSTTDLNGATSCTQVITFYNPNSLTDRVITIPTDVALTDCPDGELLPEDLNGFPEYETFACDMVAATYEDEEFLFAGNSDACFKILRTWTVIDWCRMNIDPDYIPYTAQQTIKISNSDAPTILTGCEAETFFTQDCTERPIMLVATADDACTPNDQLATSYTIDYDSDGTTDVPAIGSDGITGFGESIEVMGSHPLGCHIIYFSFEDRCGNKETCAKEFCIVNDKAPTAACIDGLGIALEPMDLIGNDGIADNEMACLFAEMLDASSVGACPDDILTFCFSEEDNIRFQDIGVDDPSKLTFDCNDIGFQTITFIVKDQDGNTDVCVTEVEVQDNNLFDNCPNFDLALIKTLSSSTPGPYRAGDNVTFDITVYNQGDFDAFNVELIDYIPAGLTFSDALGNWTATATTAVYSGAPINIPIGEQVSIPITFTIDAGFSGELENIAEITGADNDMDPDNEPPTDMDSDPDTDPDNDPIIPDVNDDPEDEDDHDPEVINVFEFDLALSKVVDTATNPGPYTNGSAVTFLVNVYNQGNLDATDVVIADYPDLGFVFDATLNADFSVVGTGTDVQAVIPFLAAGNSTVLSITYVIEANFVGSELTNWAEIIAANNVLGYPDDDDDLDNTNNGGDNPNEVDDTGEPNDDPDNPADEDDYDPADIPVECAVPPVCNVLDEIKVNLDETGNVSIDSTNVDNGSAAVCNNNPVSFIISRTAFDCTDAGDTISVSVTVVDDIGNVSTNECLVDVIVCDPVPPTVVCTDINTVFDADGNLDFTAFDVVGTTPADNCRVETVELDTTQVNTEDLMNCIAQSATVIVTDINGNSTTCMFEITIRDEVDPVCNVNDLTVQIGSSTDVVTIDSSAIDNGSMDACSGLATLELDRTDFTCSDVGTTVDVVVTVTDNSGNTSTCIAMITVEDATEPICNVQDITVYLDNNGSAVIEIDSIDNGSTGGCSGDFTTSISQNFARCNDIGVLPIEFTLETDNESCTADVMVTVRDTIPPTIDCPQNLTLECGADVTNLSLYGSPDFMDNCPATVTITEDVFENLNVCNVGVITRVFTVIDQAGNSVLCQQVINIEPGDDAFTEDNIAWPTSPFTFGDCISNLDIPSLDTGEPVLEGVYDCAVTSFSFTDVDNPNADPCNEDYERIWTLIDSCQLDGLGGGIFTFTQIISLNDTVPPVLTVADEFSAELTGGDCELFVNLPGSVSDTCSNMTTITVTNDSPFANNNNSADVSGTYPAGTTIVTVTASDVCGNLAVDTVIVNLVDTLIHSLTCNKQLLALPDTLSLPVIAEDFQVEVDSSAMCDSQGWTVSYSDTDPFDSIWIVGCDEVGINNPTIYLWVANVLTDSCVAELGLANPTGGCNLPFENQGMIYGSVSTELQIPVGDADVDLIGSSAQPTQTIQTGMYAFPHMPYGGNYVIAPSKDSEHLNGVSTLDLILIQQYILGLHEFDSPYKVIAADADGSMDVNTIDILELRKLILGLYEELPRSDSWRMIDATYNFLDPSNPLSIDYPEEYSITDLNSDMIVDFVGVKVGDVNNSAKANLFDERSVSRSGNTISLITNEKYVKDGLVELAFTADQYENLQGFQFTLNVDPEIAHVLEIVPNKEIMTKQNFGNKYIAEGKIACSWNTHLNLEENQTLFTVVINVHGEGWLSEIVKLGDQVITSEAYSNFGSDNLELVFERMDLDEDIILYQNKPNPWTDNTEISFYLENEEDVRLSIIDVTGRMVFNKSWNAQAGLNTIGINKSDIESSGLMYYELVSGEHRLIKKMILVR